MGETGVIGGSLYSPRENISRGTEGSNPSPSSGESGANLSLARIRLPTSRSRGFPRVCGLRRAARSTETRKVQKHRADERWCLCRAIFQYRIVADAVCDSRETVANRGWPQHDSLLVPSQRQAQVHQRLSFL